MANLQNPLIAESKTLWIGDIDTWMDEAYIASLFAGSGAVASVKLIRDKNTGLPSGYGFVEFTGHQAAQDVLLSYNGKMIPGTNKTFRLNWGVFGGGTKPVSGTSTGNITSSTFSSQQTQALAKSAPGPEHSIYVGELDPSVNDAVLAEFFSRKYKSVIGAKVIVDPVTKLGKGFGFVKFSNFDESQAAIREMQGILLRGRAIKTSQAYMKNQGAEPNTGNLTSNVNPLTAIANNPFLLSTLGSLTGMGSTGMTGVGGVSAYGAQNFQGYPAYQGGGIGMLPNYGTFQGQTMQQGISMQNLQTSGYGYAGTGIIDQTNSYQGFPQNYGGNGMISNAYLGSFFDPTNPQSNSTQQTAYMPMGYQQYSLGNTPQYGQNQGYNSAINYLQHQQAIDPNAQQVNTHDIVQQPSHKNSQTTDALQESINKQTDHHEDKSMIEETQNIEEKDTWKMNLEPIMIYNTTCISNNFKFDFINSDKMKIIL